MNETSQRVRNPWGQGERLRVEILEAAARLLSELGGEEGLTIRGVARAAGVSPASIYQHFSDKSALVEGLIAYDFEQLAAAMDAAEAQCPSEAPLDRVRARMKAYCLFALDSPGHYRLIINNRPKPSGQPLGFVQAMITLLRRCEQTGLRLRLPAEQAAVIIFVGAHGRVGLWHSGYGDGQAQAIVGFVDQLISLVIE